MTRTIKQSRLLALMVVAISLCAAPVAAAQDADHVRSGGAVIAPAKDKWAGELIAQIYSLPLSENPFAGNGNPCLTVAHKVIQEIGGHCTIEQGTTFTLGVGSWWSSAEDPFPQTRAEQLALAAAQDREMVVGITISVDGGEPVEIRTPRFEVFSPQRTVLLPEDNILDNPEENIDIPAQTVTLSVHGWNAAIRRLSVGEHTIVGDTLFTDGERNVVPHGLTVVPRHDGNRGHRHGG
jgi:hypothetical protein